ncbi:MAG: acetyl-CoA carboxylase biotin carboxyl carrier protein subunit [Sulfuricaulis sp.]|nr:acetyl-CoA carboxylase biotin carboxyl carrier protein subunit [Sulfuricaulis sp.]
MSKQISSPMAGTIWKILVQPGDAVAAGDTVAILESMKMEIPIEAEIDGTVDAIVAPEGTVLDDGSAVITLR